MADRGWGYVDSNTVDEMSAITVLDASISLYPESTLFATPACRAVIVPQHGTMVGSDYRGRLPLSIDVATKIAMYTGSRTGVWNSERAFDATPNNHVTKFRDINDTYMSDSMYDRYWSVGVIWAQNVNRTTAFYPAFSTVYADDTSVLRGLPFIMAICQTWKYAHRSWVINTGNQKLTKEQIVSRSNDSIANDIAGKFDQRFAINVDTYFTPADTQRGYSWSCDITIGGDVMPTVGQYSIIVERRGNATALGTNV